MDPHPTGPARVLDASEAGQVRELEAAIGHGALDIVELRRRRPGLGQVPTVWLVSDGAGGAEAVTCAPEHARAVGQLMGGMVQER